MDVFSILQSLPYRTIGWNASSQTILLTFNWVKLSILFLMHAFYSMKRLVSSPTFHPLTHITHNKLLKIGCIEQFYILFVFKLSLSQVTSTYSMNIRRQTNFIDSPSIFSLLVFLHIRIECLTIKKRKANCMESCEQFIEFFSWKMKNSTLYLFDDFQLKSFWVVVNSSALFWIQFLYTLT